MAEPRRGKTYACLYCEAAGKAYLEVRYRVIAHIYKHHVALDQAPYYCTLCLLRCTTKATLINHVTRYSRHRLAAAENGVTDDKRFLVSNPQPASVVLGKDYKEVSNLEASKYVNCTGMDDWSEIEGEFCREPSAVETLTPVVSNRSTGLISVQLTPEMLAKLLQSQNNTASSVMQPVPVTIAPVAEPSNIPLYSPAPVSKVSLPSYTPTPIVRNAPALLKRSPAVPLSPIDQSQPVFSAQPFMPCVSSPQKMCNTPLLDEPSLTSNVHQPPRSTLHTPRISTCTENILPDLLGEQDSSEYDFGLNDNWVGCQQPTQLGIKTSTVTLTSGENPLPDQETAKKKIEGETNAAEPEAKRRRLDGEENPSNLNVDIGKMIESLVENSVKQMVDAFERNSRAIRGVDKTLGELKEVMTRMNRTLERMGEEQRKEHERRREESREQERRLTPKKTEENYARKNEGSRKEGKENRTLKSSVNKV